MKTIVGIVDRIEPGHFLVEHETEAGKRTHFELPLSLKPDDADEGEFIQITVEVAEG